MKKIVLILLLLIITFPSFAQAERETAAESDYSFTFTDDLGRSFTFSSPIEKIAPSGNMAQMVLYPVAKDMMVGLANPIGERAYIYNDEKIESLPIFGAFYGRRSNLNKEEVILQDPDVIIDMGEIKGDAENTKDDLDNLTKSLGIPVVFIECYLENTAEAYRKLGTLLGNTEECEKRAVYAEDAINLAKEKKQLIKDPVRVYYSSSADGLSAIESGSFHAEVIELVGGENVVEKSFSEGNGIASLEEIILWDPDVILLSEKEAYDYILKDKTWNTLRAVQNGDVYLLPSSPYPFIDNPPSVNRIIGIYYLGSLLYPDLYSEIDLRAKIKEFYSLFYLYGISDSEIDSLLNI